MIKYGWKRLVIVPSWARSLSLCRFTFRLPKFILFLSPFVSALFQHLLLLSFNRVNLYPWNDFLFFCLNCFLFCISWFLLLFILSPTSLFKMPLCQCSPSPLRPPALSLVQPVVSDPEPWLPLFPWVTRRDVDPAKNSHLRSSGQLWLDLATENFEPEMLNLCGILLLAFLFILFPLESITQVFANRLCWPVSHCNLSFFRSTWKSGSTLLRSRRNTWMNDFYGLQVTFPLITN